jgi:hypothetical protein
VEICLSVYELTNPPCGLFPVKSRREAPNVLGRGGPMGIQASGSVYVTEGTDRRSTGTHYTPRSLTEPIVRYTLEPLVYEGPAEGKLKEDWRLKSARELLSLKVCDMATGSGAFLVEACRYLSERLMEAWEEAEGCGFSKQANLRFDKPHPLPSPKVVPRITPFGHLAQGRLDEQLIPPEAGDRAVYARRLVAQRCLYGVDKNPMAVEMAKLSLWLLTLAKGQPFTFLDHAIRCGDSLVGIHDLEQLRYFDLRGKVNQPRYALDSLRSLVDKATELRLAIEERTIRDIEDVQEQERMLEEAEGHTERLRIAADLLLAEAFGEGDQPFICLTLHFRDADIPTFRREAMRYTKGRRTFHWPLEFPEVFARGGFDAFMGNPPFMGGSKITGNLGTAYREFLVRHLAQGKRGNADLAAYFFLQAAQLLHEAGGFGLISTNTIAQGDTREVALDLLLALKYVVCRAHSSRPWPGTASLEVSVVWVRRGGWNGMYVLDDKPVSGITPFLTAPLAVAGNPHRLKANEGKSFTGNKVYGEGFLLAPDAADRLLTLSSRNRDVLFPYLSGDDLTSQFDQSPTRWVINFGDMSEDDARTYPDCFEIVDRLVRPYRETVKRQHTRENWWLHEHTRQDLYDTIRTMEQVLVCPIVTKYLSFSFTAVNIVFMHKVCVFSFNTWAAFSLLSSTVHEVWTREYSSTLETRLNYSPTDCFETFPFPGNQGTVLADIGNCYYTRRQGVMLARREGLTKTYNRYHDPSQKSDDLATLRRLHVEMDHAVAAAYGWADLDLDHGFHQTKQGLRYTISEPARQEVLARLLRLNHERYAEEVRQGLHEKKKPAAAKTRKKQEARGLFE